MTKAKPKKTTVDFDWHENQMKLASRNGKQYREEYFAQLNIAIELRKENMSLRNIIIKYLIADELKGK